METIRTSEIHDRLDTVSLLGTTALEKLDNGKLDEAVRTVEDLVLHLESVISDIYNKSVFDDIAKSSNGDKTSLYETELSYEEMNLIQEMLLKRMVENQERLEYLEYRTRYLFENDQKFTETELKKFEKEIREELMQKSLNKDFLAKLRFKLLTATHTYILGETQDGNNY